MKNYNNFYVLCLACGWISEGSGCTKKSLVK